jgi:SAM-dependent methyltransferase
MFWLIYRQLKKRTEWLAHSRKLAKMRSMEEFERYAEVVRPAEFLKYRDYASLKRAEIEAVLKVLEIDVAGKAVLDIGPGHGESLDVFHEHKASEVHFIEYNPFFMAYNRLKGFCCGLHGNHFVKIRELPGDHYHFIWCRGSIRDDAFRYFGWLYSVDRWLRQIERILAPGGLVVICPCWAMKDGQRRQSNVRDAPLTRAMLKHGFTVLPAIEHHNSEPAYPISYLKVKD